MDDLQLYNRELAIIKEVLSNITKKLDSSNVKKFIERIKKSIIDEKEEHEKRIKEIKEELNENITRRDDLINEIRPRLEKFDKEYSLQNMLNTLKQSNL